MNYDIYQPKQEPAKRFYDAILKEAELRKTRNGLQWIDLEIQNMHRVATTYAKENNLPIPSLEEIKSCERYANGHVDYAAKWAHQLSNFFHKPPYHPKK